VHLGIFISVINQLDAQNVCFTVSLFHASTSFEHMCSSSGGQNALHSLWYRHTETSEWSKITKTQFYKYEQILVKFISIDSLQKTAILGTSHIIRKVLQCEA
jgi:hypothetical protein